MRKLVKSLLTVFMLLCLFTVGGIIADKQQLKQGVVRLHVLANSDLQCDQEQKLQVKDAIVSYLQPKLQQFENKSQAMQYLQEQIPNLEALANTVLEKGGSVYRATVTLDSTVFDRRDYDTFSLPAGVYDALRVQIGAAEGKNWWCVVFPSLCISAASDEFTATAASSGFDTDLVNTLQRSDGYEIRFFLLDCLGKLENFFAGA